MKWKAENFIKRPQYKGQTPKDRRTDQHLEKPETSHAHSLRFFSSQMVLTRRSPSLFDQDTMCTINAQKIDSAQIPECP